KDNDGNFLAKAAVGFVAGLVLAAIFPPAGLILFGIGAYAGYKGMGRALGENKANNLDTIDRQITENNIAKNQAEREMKKRGLLQSKDAASEKDASQGVSTGAAS